MHVAVSGLGTTGLQIANLVSKLPAISGLRLYDPKPDRLAIARATIDAAIDIYEAPPTGHHPVAPTPTIAFLAGPVQSQVSVARDLVDSGCHVVSISDGIEDVRGLIRLDQMAIANRVTVVVGAGFCPGLSGLLVAYGVAQLDSVEAINVATTGTGGPACARQHHQAIKNSGLEWIDGQWSPRRGRSGRDLVWFPEPIGASDCYRAALASPLLVQQAFPLTNRIGARMSANRRDSLTSRLPMLRRPHLDGGPGAIRVEIRGRVASRVETKIFGVAASPSTAAATTATLSAESIIDGSFPPGAYGLASAPEPSELLATLHGSGIVVSSFDGYLQTAH